MTTEHGYRGLASFLSLPFGRPKFPQFPATIHHIDWNATLTIGTVVLAVATFVMARESRKTNKLSQRAFLTSIRPVLVDIPPHSFETNEAHDLGNDMFRVTGASIGVRDASEVFVARYSAENVGCFPDSKGRALVFSIGLTNAGHGIARIVGLRLSVGSAWKSPKDVPFLTYVSLKHMVPGSFTRISFLVRDEDGKLDQPLIETVPFEIAVSYSNLDASELFTTKIFVPPKDSVRDGLLRADRVEIEVDNPPRRNWLPFRRMCRSRSEDQSQASAEHMA